MPENFYPEQSQPFGVQRQESLNRYTAKTFGMMFLGLLVTFAIAFYLSNTLSGIMLTLNVLSALPWLQVGILIAELVVVLVMSARLRKMSPVTATVCFFLYAVLTGITFGILFLAGSIAMDATYNLGNLAMIFGFTALYFGGMAVFGFLTKIDLSRLRTLLVGGLIALIVANILMAIFNVGGVAERVMCTIGVIIFLAYTAYDTQKIKAFYYGFQGDDAMLKKASVISALELYLDFINLFLYLLRLFGKRKN